MHWLASDADGQLAVLEADDHTLVPDAASHGDLFFVHALVAARALAQGRRPAEALPPAAGNRVLVVIEPTRAVGESYRASASPSAFEVSLEDRACVVRAHGPRIVVSRDPLEEAQCDVLAADRSIALALGEHALARFASRSGWTGAFRYVAKSPVEYARVSTPEDALCVGDLPWPVSRDLVLPRAHTRFRDRPTLDVRAAFEGTTLAPASEVWSPRRRPFLGLDGRTSRRLGVALGVATALHVLIWLAMR